MPNWKKLITSGSDAALSNLDVTNAVTASALAVSGNISVSGTSFLDGLVTIDNNLNIQASGVLKMSGTEVISALRHISATTGNFTGAITASAFVGDGSALTGIAATSNPFVTTPTTLSSNFSTSANTMNILQSPAGSAFAINSGVTLTIVETSTVIVQTI